MPKGGIGAKNVGTADRGGRAPVAHTAPGGDEDKGELLEALSMYASSRVSKHASAVEAHVDQLRHGGGGGPCIGQHVCIGGSSSWRGKLGKIVGRDGARIVVLVEGRSELCRLTLDVECVEVLQEQDEGGEEGRDFSDIHALATEHARRSAKREVQRLAEMADERRRVAEQEMSVAAAPQLRKGLGGKGAYRQRCKHGADCGKPGCRCDSLCLLQPRNAALCHVKYV